MRNKKIKFLSCKFICPVVVLILLLFSVFSAIFLSYENQDLRNQAWKGNSFSRNGVILGTGNVTLPKNLSNFKENDIRRELRSMKEIGISLVLQGVPPTTPHKQVISFMDIVQQEGMKAVLVSYDEKAKEYNKEDSLKLLKMVKSHPALYGYFLVDEPYEFMKADELKKLYAEAKEIAPNVKISVQFSRELEKSANNKAYQLTDKMCDICGISSLEFRNYGDENIFYEDRLINNHLVSRAIVSKNSPRSEIWNSVQVFGSETSTYYMPSPEELKKMLEILFSEELQKAGAVDIIFLQRWIGKNEAQIRKASSLSDDDSAVHRKVIKDFFADKL